MVSVLPLLVGFVCSLVAHAPLPNPRSKRTPARARLAQTEALDRSAQDIDARLTRLASEYRAFLDDPYLSVAARYFGAMQSAANALTTAAKPVPAEVNRLHVNLDEFVRALEQLEDGWKPNTTGLAEALRGKKPPSAKTGKALGARLEELRKLANSRAGFEEVGRVRLFDSSSAIEAVEYGRRVLDRVEHVLYSRGLGQITGQGRTETNEVIGDALRDLRACVEELVDEHGERRVVKDEDGTPLRDPLAHVTRALDATRKKADIARNQLSHVRRRVEIVQEELKRLAENVAKPTSLRP